MPQNKKILVVDDEEMICRVLTRFLGRDGHEVYAAGNAVDALSLFRKHGPFDVLLCDLHLGEDDGWAVAEQVSKLQPNIVIIVLTGYLDTGHSPPGLIYSVLNKPFTPSQLKDVLGELLGL